MVLSLVWYFLLWSESRKGTNPRVKNIPALRTCTSMQSYNPNVVISFYWLLDKKNQVLKIAGKGARAT